MDVSEKVAYLKGLADGLGVDKETKEGKLFAAIIDALDTMAEEINSLGENALDIGDELDALSDDLADVESLIYDDDDDDDDDDCCCDDDDDDCCCDEEAMFSVTCPACNEEITLDESVLDLGGIDCPNCGEKLEFEFDDDEDGE